MSLSKIGILNLLEDFFLKDQWENQLFVAVTAKSPFSVSDWAQTIWDIVPVLPASPIV